MISGLLAAAFVLFALAAVVVFIFNANTPLQLGAAPFFVSVILSLICLVWLVARHLVWR